MPHASILDANEVARRRKSASKSPSRAGIPALLGDLERLLPKSIAASAAADARNMTKALPVIDFCTGVIFNGKPLSTVGAHSRAGDAGPRCRHQRGEQRANDQAFAQLKVVFALPVVEKQRTAIQTASGNRGPSVMHEALIWEADMKEAFNVGFDLKPTTELRRQALRLSTLGETGHRIRENAPADY